MSNIDIIYMDLINKILKEGKLKKNRTGVDTISITGHMLEYDMSNGFPLITTKKMAWKTLRVELEGFIKGITDKNWYKERGCNIWNEWCNPQKIQYGHDDKTKAKMEAENDLGAIYGFQWRNFNGSYYGPHDKLGVDSDYLKKRGVDQLAWAIDQVKNNPNSRRILVNAWNPQQLDEMALVPCHYGFQLLVNDGVLDLLFSMRSNDVFLGLPFNIASYALLLELIAKECGLKAGKLVAFLADVHIYTNHFDAIEVQRNREPFNPPTLKLDDVSLFDWEWSNATLEGYESHPPIKAEVAV